MPAATVVRGDEDETGVTPDELRDASLRVAARAREVLPPIKPATYGDLLPRLLPRMIELAAEQDGTERRLSRAGALRGARPCAEERARGLAGIARPAPEAAGWRPRSSAADHRPVLPQMRSGPGVDPLCAGVSALTRKMTYGEVPANDQSPPSRRYETMLDERRLACGGCGAALFHVMESGGFHYVVCAVCGGDETFNVFDGNCTN
jgi:hypothetical protein